LKAVRDHTVRLYGLGFHTMSLPLYTLSLFLPTIIKELGYTAAQAELLTVPPYAVGTTLTVLVAVASEKFHRRAPFIMAGSCVAITLLTDTRLGVSYVGTIVAASGIYPLHRSLLIGE
jgi:MFS family permease